jgi:hypothetical protein
MPELKTFPYDTDIPCKVCKPAHLDEPPKMQVRMERNHPSGNIHRTLECPNCGERSDDLWNPQLQSVVFNRELDDAAARGLPPRSVKS